MKYRFFASFYLFFFSLVIIAQPPAHGSKTKEFNTPTGKWRVEQYAANILKLSFFPSGYTATENVTDAVIQKKVDLIDTSLFSFSNGQMLLGHDKKIVVSVSPETEGYRGFCVELKNGEMIFGGGESALPLNRRGYRFNLYNNPWYGYSEGADNLNFSVPFFTSSKGYGLFFDNGSKGFADIGKKHASVFEAGFVSGELNVYVILGENYQQILAAYQQLTGKQPMPPKWAMGSFMSRFGYTSEEQVKTIATKMKAAAIPFDAVIFDLFWFGDSIKGTMGNLDWVNKSKWPHPKQLINDFKQQQIHSILITEPFFLQQTKAYPFALPYLAKDSMGKPYQLQDFYFGKGGLLDIFRKEAGDWLWNYHYKKQIINGIAGWWTDLGEPEKHPSDMLHNLKDLGVKRLMKADEVHNLYGHYWNKMLFENYAKYLPNTRLFHLNRSGFSGSQRYSIYPWTGDVNRNWSGFRAQLTNILGMSMSGIPYIHSDAGGFAMGEADPELYLRWLQFAVYTPIFRPHGTALFETDPSAFSYASEPALADISVLDKVKSAVALRYQLLPYNYTLAYRQAAFGDPLIRPLYYQYPHDSIAVSIDNQFMWGDAILVAPVVEKAQNSKQVYLPKGTWYVQANNTYFTGPGFITFNTNDFQFPAFIKDGSFIPQNIGLMAHVSDQPKTLLDLLYVPSESPSSYQLYQDDGESKNAISTKQFELINFSSKGLISQTLDITIASNRGNYIGKPSKTSARITIPLIDKQPQSVSINGKKLTILDATNALGMSANQQVVWNFAQQHQLQIPFILTVNPMVIHIQW